MKPQHFFITLFALITCCTIVGIIKLANTGLNLQTDLLSLIPASSRSPVVQKANDQLTNKFGNNFIYLVAANNQQSLLTTNKAIIQIIKDNQSIKLDDNQLAVENRITYFQWLKQYRFQLLNESQRNTLTDNDSSTLIQNAWRSLYNPGTVANIASPVEDPLNLFNQYLEQTYSSDNNFEIINNSVFITSEDHPDQHYNLISGSIASGAFSLQAQQELSISTTKIQNYIAAQNDNTKLYRAGAVFHATTAAHSAKRDISLISSGSALGIFILFISCFKSIRPLLASLASIIYGCICALVFCLWYFQSLHLLTLVFGASLIGVAIDYAVHYLSHASHENNRSNTLRRLLPSLVMGLATSLIGFSSLLQAPLLGLKQMAIFSMVGLASAWLFVVAIFPLFNFNNAKLQSGNLSTLASLPERIWHWFNGRQLLIGLCFITLITSAVTFNFISTSKDIRVLYTPNKQLINEQQIIEEILPKHAPNQFFLITNDTPQQLLQSAEKFKSILDRQVTQGAISGYQLISDYLPSKHTQQTDKQLLQQTIYQSGGIAEQFMTSAGFDLNAIDDFSQQLSFAEFTPLQTEQWLELAPPEKQLLWLGNIADQFSSVVLLSGVKDLSSLKLAAKDVANISFVDTVEGISNALESKRQSASTLLILAYVAIAALLLARYRRYSALRLLCIPGLSSLLTLTLLTAAGVAISLFHVFALFLVLGLGMDYSIFLHEACQNKTAKRSQDHTADNPRQGQDYQHCQLAILLSAITSGLSFGLLSLSSTPMIAAFGITVLTGSALNWLLVPLIIKTPEKIN